MALRQVAEEQRRPIQHVVTAAVEEYVCRRAAVTNPCRGLADYALMSRLDRVPPDELPEQLATSATTMAELMACPYLGGRAHLARRSARTRRMQMCYEVLPFDSDAARSYATLTAIGATARGFGLLVASVAAAHGLPLYTTEPDAYHGISELVTVVPVWCGSGEIGLT